MVDWIASIFSWLWNQLEPWIRGIWEVVRKQAWAILTALAAILAPIGMVINFWAEQSYFVVTETQKLVEVVRGLQVGDAGGFWSAISHGASLMNCIVALDYGIAIGSTLFGIYCFIGVAKGLVWLYRLIPGKFT